MKNMLRRGCCIGLGLLWLVAGHPAGAIEPKDGGGYLDQKEFHKRELELASSHEALEDALARLPNRAAWESFLAAREAAGQGKVKAFVDPRSGGATNLLGTFPGIPGRGNGDRVTLADVGARLGRAVQAVDGQVVADLAR